MKTFTIDADNSITAFASEKDAASADCTTLACFTSEQELGKLAATWPGDRLIEIWNSLPGVTPVKKFTDHKSAVSRIWKAIQNLGELAAAKEAPVAEQGAHVAPEKASSNNDASQQKGAPKRQKNTKRGKAKAAALNKEAKGAKKAAKPERKTTAPRAESKGAKILEMIGRAKGATLAEIMKATDWQAHSVRGFISTAAKKHKVNIESSKNEVGDRVYKVAK